MIKRHALFILLASASLGACGSENAGDRPGAASSAAAQRLMWLDTFGKEPMSDEAAAFMYMQLALEEMPADGQE